MRKEFVTCVALPHQHLAGRNVDCFDQLPDALEIASPETGKDRNGCQELELLVSLHARSPALPRWSAIPRGHHTGRPWAIQECAADAGLTPATSVGRRKPLSCDAHEERQVTTPCGVDQRRVVALRATCAASQRVRARRI